MNIGDVPPDRPVLIAGPTASGKSTLALQIALEGGGVVINADALQVYDCWQILSARPTADDLAMAPHALYGHIRRDEPYSVGHWLRDVQDVLAQGQRPVIVGGTGLYFAALTTGLAPIPDIPPDVRTRGDMMRLAGDLAGMLNILDPVTLSRIDQQNPARVQRAWEVWQTTGRGLADWQSDTPSPLLPITDCTPIVLTPDRDWLAARIDRRFDSMMQAGALDEVAAILPDWNPTAPWAQAIGAAELVAYLRGLLPLDDAVGQAKLASRQYAKRQRTWCRNRMKGWQPDTPQ